ncbi:hypothetical protein [Exiguobacterium sp. s78]|uniref:hypothetical protein n=1 Tax=Exiguobacterium sp. s78 TaxID=2751197 RepID=UPI001BE636F6|nr:hypothetical protein [Exiguobacterium sp. s78]
MKKYIAKGAAGVAALTVILYGTHELKEKDNMIEKLDSKQEQTAKTLKKISIYREVERQEFGTLSTAYKQKVKELKKSTTKQKSYKQEVSDLKKRLASLSNQSQELKKKLD